MKRDVGVYIEDALESVSKIEIYTAQISEEQFYADSQVQDAVIRRLEILGEAVKNIPQEVRDAYTDIPW